MCTLFTPALLFSKVAYFLTPGTSPVFSYPTPSLNRNHREAQRTMDYSDLVHCCNRTLDGCRTKSWLIISPSEIPKVSNYLYVELF
jgi:hypothetical protein